MHSAPCWLMSLTIREQLAQADAARLEDLDALEQEHRSELLAANRKMNVMNKIAELSCRTIIGMPGAWRDVGVMDALQDV